MSEGLYEFYVAGVKFHELHKCIDNIKVGDSLPMEPEPTNKYDPNAIKLHFGDFMVGYVPAKLSADVSAELSIRPLICVVTEVNPAEKPWAQLKVAIWPDEEGDDEE